MQCLACEGRWYQLLIKSTFLFIRSRNRFSFIIDEIHIVKPTVVIKRWLRLDCHIKIDSVSCKFYSYILFITKLFKIEIGIRILILNLIIGEIFITKLYYLFLILTIVYKSNQILNMSFCSWYIKELVNWLYPRFAKNALYLKDFFNIINNIFIINNFNILVWI